MSDEKINCARIGCGYRMSFDDIALDETITTAKINLLEQRITELEAALKNNAVLAAVHDVCFGCYSEAESCVCCEGGSRKVESE